MRMGRGWREERGGRGGVERLMGNMYAGCILNVGGEWPSI